MIQTQTIDELEKEILETYKTYKESNKVYVELEHVVIKKDDVTASYSSYTDDWESEVLVIYNGKLDKNDKLTISTRSIYIDGKLHKSGDEKNIGLDIDAFDQKVNERIVNDVEKKLKLMQNVDYETKAMGFDLLDSLTFIRDSQY